MTVEGNIISIPELSGIKYRIVSIKRLSELKNEYEENHKKKLFNEEFYEERLTKFSFEFEKSGFHVKSIVIAAIPCPQTRITFSFNGKKYPLILPPTYSCYSSRKEKALRMLSDFLEPMGFKAETANIPEKLLAVRSGLAEYGRNNITYVDGLGSFYSPAAFYSDVPYEDDIWMEPRMMDKCNNCRACLIKCPTGAIPDDRFLLSAERCIVFHNERSPEIPFPEWIDPSAHNAIVGCMTCQKYCPEDKKFLDWFEEDEFTMEETSGIYQGIPLNQLNAGTLAKLEKHELIEYYPMLPRNLKILFV